MKMNKRMFARTNGLPIMALAVLLFIGCGDVGEGDTAKTGDAVEIDVQESTVATGSYVLDNGASSIGWYGAKVTGSHDGGFKKFTGTLKVGDGELAHAKIDIEMASVWSDTEKLTGHLMTDDFFEVEKFPTSTFEASSFSKVDSDSATHQVTGNLTMRGVTKGISFPANVEIVDGMVRASANFIINRQEWGIAYEGMPDDVVNDDVRITLDIVAKADEPVAMAR